MQPLSEATQLQATACFLVEVRCQKLPVDGCDAPSWRVLSVSQSIPFGTSVRCQPQTGLSGHHSVIFTAYS